MKIKQYICVKDKDKIMKSEKTCILRARNERLTECAGCAGPTEQLIDLMPNQKESQQKNEKFIHPHIDGSNKSKRYWNPETETYWVKYKNEKNEILIVDTKLKDNYQAEKERGKILLKIKNKNKNKKQKSLEEEKLNYQRSCQDFENQQKERQGKKEKSITINDIRLKIEELKEEKDKIDGEILSLTDCIEIFETVFIDE